MNPNRPVGTHDASLAARLVASRPDLAALQTEVGTSQPAGAVAEVQQVKNDVRLPSHAPLDLRLPLPGTALPRAEGPASVETRWSVAARAIGAVLADLEADAEPVRGTAPLWTPAQKAPSGPVLAAALAQTLSGSGMFYESHLAEFVNGLRTPAQLAEEPQMRLTQSQPRPDAASPRAAAAASALPVPQSAALPVLAPAAPPATAATPAAGSAAAPAAAAVEPPAPQPHASPEVALYQSTARIAEAPAAAAHRAALAAQEIAQAPAERTAEREGVDAGQNAQGLRAHPVDVIHPQTTALVHQQLDLLATAVFRWSGQAWPEVPMTWTVHPEADAPGHDDEARGEARDDDAAAVRRWVTTVSLALPRLGTVDLRLALSGEQVQARLAAGEASTLERLRRGSAELAPRLEAAGLQLQEFRVTARHAEEQHP